VQVRLVGVVVAKVSKDGYQLDLFDQHRQRRLRKLYQGVDRIRSRYGFEALRTGPSIFLPRPSPPPEKQKGAPSPHPSTSNSHLTTQHSALSTLST
jgi:hypothetical protein